MDRRRQVQHGGPAAQRQESRGMPILSQISLPLQLRLVVAEFGRRHSIARP